MKILLLLKGPNFLRPFVDTVRELASRGHEIRIAIQQAKNGKGIDELTARFAGVPSVSFATVSAARSVDQREVALIRRTWNYLRYLEPAYRDAAKLRRRSFDKVGRLLFELESTVDPAWSDIALGLTPRELGRLTSVFEYIERLVPTDPACDAFLRNEDPDVVLMSPLVDLNSSTQADFAKSARQMGIPIGLLVYSWDNLSTKGGLHVMPDRVFVWNRRQYREAKELHHVPGGRIVMTGAPRFDGFLARAAQLPRDRYAESLGLDASRPIVTYVCSSAFVSGQELTFVRAWLRSLRESVRPALCEVNVVVRPHPDLPLTAADEPSAKTDWGLDDLVGTIWRPFDDPRAVVLGTASSTPQGLYECLWHSDAVVGLNTSAEIEAGILGKPVLSILADQTVADGQQDTLHFRYLLKEQGGFVDVAADLPAHAEQLEAALQRTPAERKALYRCAMRFVRPHGSRVPVSSVLADAIETEMLKPAPTLTART